MIFASVILPLVVQSAVRGRVVVYERRYSLPNGLAAEVLVTNSPTANDLLTVTVTRGARKIWSRRESISDGPIAPDIQEAVHSTVYDEAASRQARLIVIQAPIPDWNQSVLWSVGLRPSRPVILRDRDEWQDISSFEKDRSGAVIRFELHDRWIGGESHSRMRPSRNNDDIVERVSHYVPTGRGIVLVWWRDRQVAHFGGGVKEKHFVWISPRHYVRKLAGDE